MNSVSAPRASLGRLEMPVWASVRSGSDVSKEFGIPMPPSSQPASQPGRPFGRACRTSILSFRQRL